MPRFVALALAIFGVLAVSGKAQQTPSLATLKTRAEASNYHATSTYEDVVTFMQAVAAAAPALVHYTTYGTTYEGRAMPMAVVGTGLRDASAASVKATGKLRVHIQANVHSGEVEGKEASLVLLREFAMGQHAEWLQSTVFLVTPDFNADGNERVSMTNRGPQNGPVDGQGTRANAQNLNINRDYTKLDTPEGSAFVKLWLDYDPHVGFDLHTSDGSTHGYYLTYSPPLNPDTSDVIMKIMKDEWFPFVTRTIKDQHGWETFYYGNASSPGGRGGRGRGRGGAGATTPTPEVVGAPPPAETQRAWATFEPVPRFHNNYVGLRNRFALLSEAYAYATFEDRIKATQYFLDAALTFAHQHAARLKQACADGDKESIVGKSEATRAQFRRGGTVNILMGEVDSEKNPNTGANMNRRKDVTHSEPMVDMMWFEPSVTEDVPSAYYVPAAATNALALLRKHGIQMRQLTASVAGIEQFVITSNTARPVTGSIDFGQHALRTLDGSWQAAADVAVPAGAWAVPMNQPLARLAFYLLAPTSDDGLVNWNVLDDLLQDAKTYPILRNR